MCSSVSGQGTGGRVAAAAAVAGASACGRCRRRVQVASVAFTNTASAAFQPKWASMKALSQPQVLATISTGGAAYAVSVPPMDTFTSSTPSAKYLRRSGTAGRKICGASISAAMVMAAGSVMSEPSSGTAASPSQAAAMGRGRGSHRAACRTAASTVCRMGREAAITITTKTNSGSV